MSEHWRQDAGCKELLEMSPETFDDYFYPDSFRDQAVTKMAKKICAACTVRLECLHDAQLSGDRQGLRGGLTPGERSKLDIPRQRGGEGA